MLRLCNLFGLVGNRMLNHFLCNLLDLLIGKIEVPALGWHLDQGFGIRWTAVYDKVYYCIKPALIDHLRGEQTGEHPTYPVQFGPMTGSTTLSDQIGRLTYCQ